MRDILKCALESLIEKGIIMKKGYMYVYKKTTSPFLLELYRLDLISGIPSSFEVGIRGSYNLKVPHVFLPELDILDMSDICVPSLYFTNREKRDEYIRIMKSDTIRDLLVRKGVLKKDLVFKKYSPEPRYIYPKGFSGPLYLWTIDKSTWSLGTAGLGLMKEIRKGQEYTDTDFCVVGLSGKYIYLTIEERDKAWEEFKDEKRKELRGIFRKFISLDYTGLESIEGWTCNITPRNLGDTVFPKPAIRGNFETLEECLRVFEENLNTLINKVGGL